MGKTEALNELKTIVQDGDTFVDHQYEVRNSGPNTGWMTTYAVYVRLLNISWLMADALEGMIINEGSDAVLEVSKPAIGTITTFSDARTLTILLGEALGMPAHEHFNFEVI